METAFDIMGWFSKIFKGSEHKVSEGQYDWRYGAEPVENNPSTSWVSIYYIHFQSHLWSLECHQMFLSLNFPMPWRLILKLSMLVNLVRECYVSILLGINHAPVCSLSALVFNYAPKCTSWVVLTNWFMAGSLRI